ncbi:lycopene beta-cyclase CrtY [Sphingomonas sp. HDW15A]|uniref:lycopene beta-cyclase CrtY n=1 Tax=Sphingomonas sp. HDW15A TaxID=2714942 RepID=UPI00140BB1B3|nr:lycopene beta-cyclase CrtY [Sphingomonas sp. HDW15A]QIK95168.1 lycopene beta-cyclase CrtY [Sphingomonas sp. HDW15A]
MERRDPLVIVGGGLAGALAALALAERRPELPLLLVEGGETFGGNHVWSYFDGDLDPDGAAVVAPLRPARWPSHQVHFPNRVRNLGFGYNSIHSENLDRLVRKRLDPKQYRVGTRIASIGTEGITVDGGGAVRACGVIDARGPSEKMPGLELAWQKFVGIELRSEAHGLATPIIMDATVEQIDGYRFLYSLPFSEDRLLIEDTYYSDTAKLNLGTIKRRIHDYAASNGWNGEEIREEIGVLPVLLDGDPDAFWPKEDPVPRLGIAGGFFHPTTGYSLPLAVSNAMALARLDDFSGPALARWTRSRFLDHWRAGRFFRALNRMLFRAAKPHERVRVFEHFYRLPDDMIGRFYAGRLSFADKLRVLTGKPPVPVGRALKALAA